MNYVQSVITPGVKVRRINGDWRSVRQGDTGVVTRVEKDSRYMLQIYADWDVAGKDVCGGYCEGIELID